MDRLTLTNTGITTKEIGIKGMITSTMDFHAKQGTTGDRNDEDVRADKADAFIDRRKAAYLQRYYIQIKVRARSFY